MRSVIIFSPHISNSRIRPAGLGYIIMSCFLLEQDLAGKNLLEVTKSVYALGIRIGQHMHMYTEIRRFGTF